jgi:hypothetical protein
LVLRRGNPGFQRLFAPFNLSELQTPYQHRPGETLGDDKGIVAQLSEEFAQHLGLLAVPDHAIHLTLQIFRSKRSLPVILERL